MSDLKMDGVRFPDTNLLNDVTSGSTEWDDVFMVVKVNIPTYTPFTCKLIFVPCCKVLWLPQLRGHMTNVHRLYLY